MTAFLSHLETVCGALDACGIQYVLGGSLASSLWSRPRQTNDADLAIRSRPGADRCLAERLGNDYIVFPRDWTSLDLTESYPCAEISHISGDFRCDLFLTSSEPFADSEFERAVVFEIGTATPKPIASPEDIVIQKLRWYELGNRISDRQWNDIVQVLEVQAGRLDLEYLQKWAKHFGLTQLLDEAIAETEPYE